MCGWLLSLFFSFWESKAHKKNAAATCAHLFLMVTFSETLSPTTFLALPLSLLSKGGKFESIIVFSSMIRWFRHQNSLGNALCSVYIARPGNGLALNLPAIHERTLETGTPGRYYQVLRYSCIVHRTEDAHRTRMLHRNWLTWAHCIMHIARIVQLEREISPYGTLTGGE